ncbi:BAH and coiled-coil domain-containing protein [Actinidia chinensis var. chinensis]|uniref:BAH and coiled-coil domain-containing protein n=1 Tax=Actinidia chinensis var. chinensis TaxID=1590841 RepID=A0A2R6PUF4_ACTCC|nr:BAH and coiled-coil domain-containing protein [Actinidia chinensis var. chinensis]
MHGWGGENRKRVRHMWSVPTVAGDSVAAAPDSFCKDGRKISVGDCALFKPPQDSPPFIGIIRWLTLDRENNLQLGVNWLYRPGEVKLGKGILRDTAPNEVFYSFHKDEIPAASLLHPCKVAFLPKSFELPSRISSFVCHRVYDIANRCLWWLTDQNYIDERQEEVNQLLRKTQIEMHSTVQSDGRSPKPLNGQTSTSQLKPGADNVQSAFSFPSHVKGKKRERADQGSEPFKRERSSKTDDGDSVQFKPESLLKSDISKITEKGGLVDSEGVEKLVQLMQSDGSERKLELISRSMLAGVIAATENFDCLSRFVQLRGLPVLDDWLQDVHKGKIGHVSPKDGDKSVEEFLFVLLRALDKLPVNLHALQMCYIGKSVNHLRSHKNLEIQKKARSLVDIWKKRVEAEMNVIDAKSGSTQAISWASRSRLSEVSHGGNQHPDRGAKLKFDLNEGFIVDDGKYTEPINFAGPGSSDFNPLPSPLTSVCTGLPASITVAAAAKGPFIPPEDLLRSKGELGWKGSAATSAFRPAEPRKVLEMPLGTTNTSLPNVTAGKQGRPMLDFDLNVPDERILEDMASRNSPQEVASTSDHICNRDLVQNDLIGSVPIRSPGGLDLDLNRLDEVNDMGQYPESSSCRLDALLLPVKLSSSGGFPNFEGRRDFDLNNGPAFDEASTGPSSFSHYGKSSMQSQPHVASLRLNNADMGTFSSWFTPGTAYPAVTIPSILADRGEQAFPIVATGGPARMLGPAAGGPSLNPEIYRGSVLSSSPSVPFPSTPFQYPIYPFGAAFPLPSANFPGGSTTCMDSSSSGRLFPAVSSQLLRPAAPMSTPQYPRPYFVSFPDSSSNIGVDDNRKGSRHGLDLNSGPGSLDREGRDETSPLALRQLSVASSQALAEEQARMYNQMVGGILKRKESEGVWDAENFRHKQSSWQQG